MDALLSELKQRIVDTLGLEDVLPAEIADDAPLFGDEAGAGGPGLGLDSIDALELVVMLEKHYGIRLKDMETSRAAFRSPRALAEFVRAQRPAEA